MTYKLLSSRLTIVIFAISLCVTVGFFVTVATTDLHTFFPANAAELPPEYKPRSEAELKLVIDGKSFNEGSTIEYNAGQTVKVEARLKLEKGNWQFVPDLAARTERAARPDPLGSPRPVPMFKLALRRKSTLEPGYVAEQVRASALKLQNGRAVTEFTVDTPLRTGTYLLLVSLERRYVASDVPNSLECYLCAGYMKVD